MFKSELGGYEKGILSDLHGAWHGLRESVVDADLFPDRTRLLFHIDEAMSWESVRDLSCMQATFDLIKNIVSQMTQSKEIKFWVEEIERILSEALTSIKNGEKL